ncbi:hypothetical protein CYY_000624 [Polysphondylium violaceum]|uniref:Uncharacterized protein n=1 Tax=Polysphondylium violaceum TaxID=133409 RepID=A0A8J4V5E4_9MYCE|nr:hypothetical protein CYY_000624 [Polysphondylium violaceum]
MTKAIYLYLPIDINFRNPNYQIPTIENQKDLLCAGLNTPASVPPPTTPTNVPRRRHMMDDDEENVLSAVHDGWMEVMSFSHNVAAQNKRGRGDNDDDAIHLGELTCTKFVTADSPSLNYLCCASQILPHAIFRSVGDVKNNKVNIIEYELEYVQITNVSVSGGTGGKPVETLSINAKIIKTKYIDMDILSSEFEVSQVYKWDNINKTGSKTVHSTKGEPTKTLLEYAKKTLMVNLSSHDPSMVALIKELGLVTDYDLPEVKPSSYKIKVLSNSAPVVYKVVQVVSFDKKSIISAIAEKFNIPLETIESIYSQEDHCEIEADQSFNSDVPTHILFRTSDGKFYGY